MESGIGVFDHPAAARWPAPSLQVDAAVSAVASAARSSTHTGSLFPVFGKALLGIAGAYVLRALEETGAIPRSAVAVAGLVYAFLWLIGAARLRTRQHAAIAIYAGTSALVLAPMLWELTLRFNVLEPAAAAAVIGTFALAAFAFNAFAPASERNLKPLVYVASIAAAALALALAIASQALLPFVIVLLLLTAACEFAPGRIRLPAVTALFALAADASIWILIYVNFSGQSAHQQFPALGRGLLLAPGLALFAVSAVSIGIKTILRARPIAAFETIQTILAFLLAAVGLADFAQPDGPAILGIACLVLAVASYAAVFTVFARAPHPRNTAVFAAWGAALLLAGCFLCLPRVASLALLAAAALASAWRSRQERWTAFAFYGMVFLLASAMASGLLGFLAGALAGTPPGPLSLDVWIIAISTPLCYLLARSDQIPGRVRQILYLAFAALAAAVAAALLVDGLAALTALLLVPGAHHLALIRTIVLCAAALLLVHGASRWRRRELTYLGYAALAIVAVKLVAEDLRHGHLVYIAASIFLVAFTLIAAPRVSRAQQKA